MKNATAEIKRIASITDVLQQVGLSRSRFYELMRQGVFPKPLRHPRTNRPYYDEALQVQCSLARKTNVGVNGQPVLFYSPRRKGAPAKVTKAPQRDPFLERLQEGLEQLGLQGVDDNSLQEALRITYPSGYQDESTSAVLMTVFRHLRAKNRGQS